MLKVAAESASAFGSSGSSTSSETNDWRTGVSTALAMPSRPAKRKTCQSSTTPVATRIAKTIAVTAKAALATISSLRLS